MMSYPLNLHTRPMTSVKPWRKPVVLRVLVAFFALLIHLLLNMELLTNSQGLSAFTVLLLTYLGLEAKKLRVSQPRLFWINPVVLASIFTFVLAFGVSNILFSLPENTLYALGVSLVVTHWMNELMFLVLLGAIAMWTGYGSDAGRWVGMALQHSRAMNRWMLTSFKMRQSVLFAALLTDFLAKLMLINLGLFGYASAYNNSVDSASYTQYLGLASSLGTLVLLCVALQCFSVRQPSILNRKVLLLVLGYEILFGLLSGMKSAVVMPLLIVGIVYYSQRNRFPRWLIPAVFACFTLAYAIITPLREVISADEGQSGRDVGSLVLMMISAKNDNAGGSEDDHSTSLEFLARNNLTYVGSLGIRYASMHNELPEGSPAFLENIFLAPAHALTPRFLWKSKPLDNIGQWYTNQVLGFSFISSTAMSPFTYLNFAGGPVAVILGFLVVGIVQRGLFDGLFHFGGGGLIVFFGLLGSLVIIDNAFNNFFVNLIRYLPMLVLAQYVLLRRSSR